jgi:hypothetical protein
MPERAMDAAAAGAYRPRDGTAGVLHGVVRDHLEEFLALATRLMPRPRVNLLVSHGVFGPNARWRPEVIPVNSGL